MRKPTRASRTSESSSRPTVVRTIEVLRAIALAMALPVFVVMALSDLTPPAPPPPPPVA